MKGYWTDGGTWKFNRHWQDGDEGEFKGLWLYPALCSITTGNTSQPFENFTIAASQAGLFDPSNFVYTSENSGYFELPQLYQAQNQSGNAYHLSKYYDTGHMHYDNMIYPIDVPATGSTMAPAFRIRFYLSNGVNITNVLFPPYAAYNFGLSVIPRKSAPVGLDGVTPITTPATLASYLTAAGFGVSGVASGAATGLKADWNLNTNLYLGMGGPLNAYRIYNGWTGTDLDWNGTYPYGQYSGEQFTGTFCSGWAGIPGWDNANLNIRTAYSCSIVSSRTVRNNIIFS